MPPTSSLAANVPTRTTFLGQPSGAFAAWYLGLMTVRLLAPCLTSPHAWQLLKHSNSSSGSRCVREDMLLLSLFNINQHT